MYEGLKTRGCQYYLVGIICPPLVVIGLTDLPKSGGAMAPPAPPGTTGLPNCHTHQYVFISVHLVNRTYYKQSKEL